MPLGDLSGPYARRMSGATLYVDGGVNAMGLDAVVPRAEPRVTRASSSR